MVQFRDSTGSGDQCIKATVIVNNSIDVITILMQTQQVNKQHYHQSLRYIQK